MGSRAERQQDKSQHSGRAGRERRSDEIEGAGANKCSQGREIYGASPSPANELPLSERRRHSEDTRSHETQTLQTRTSGECGMAERGARGDDCAGHHD